MDTVSFEQWFDKNLNLIKTNMKAGEELASALAGTANGLTRLDQSACLQSLKSKVLAEVKYLLDMESSDELGFSKAKLVSAPLSFAVGGLTGMLFHHDNPLATALKATVETVSKKLPFGTVVIAIGKGGIPEDVKVFPISALARDYKTTEAKVRNTIIDRGYLLIPLEAFAAAIDKIEKLVLDGDLSLPLPAKELIKRIPPIPLSLVIRVQKL